MARQPTRAMGAQAPDEMYDQQALARAFGPSSRVATPRAVPGLQAPAMPTDVPADVQAARDAVDPTAPRYRGAPDGGVTGRRNAAADLYEQNPDEMTARVPGNVRPQMPAGPMAPEVREGALSEASPAAPAANAAWNTDGFAAPASATKFNGNVLPGWDAGKLADENHQTPKYVWGRIAAANPNKEQAVAAMLAAYPGATFNGKDKIIGIPGLGPIDIYGGASTGANVPQWIDEANAGGGAPAGGAISGSVSGAGMAGVGPASARSQGVLDSMNGSAYDTLLARLQGQLGPESTDQQALAKLLGRGV